MSGESNEEVTLLVENQEIRCQKSLLINNSDYFRILFGPDWEEKSQQSIQLPGIKYVPMAIIVRKLQDRTYVMEEQHLIDVLEIACEQYIHIIREICETELIRSLSTNNCIRIWFQIQKFYIQEISEIYLKAKAIALDQFMVIKENETLNDIELETVRHYFGNIYLQADCEITVFDAIITWVQECTYSEGHDMTDVLIKLLLCLDFSSLSRQDIQNHIMETAEIRNNEIVCDILNCYLQIVDRGEPVEVYSDRVVSYAKLLNTSSKRVEWEKASCILVELVDKHQPRGSNTSEKCLMYYDEEINSLRKLTDIEYTEFGQIDGYGLRACNGYIFVFGGSDIEGQPNTRCWEYNCFSEQWKRRNSVTPQFINHFESCVVDNKIYVVDTDGIRCWAHVYNTSTDEWSERYYISSGRPHALKCCNFMNHCIVLDLAESRQYLFDGNNLRFDDITNPNAPPGLTERDIHRMLDIGIYRLMGCFEYNVALYLKSRHNFIIFHRINQNGFGLDQSFFPYGERLNNQPLDQHDRMEIVKCHNVIYSLYQRYIGTLETPPEGGSSQPIIPPMEGPHVSDFGVCNSRINLPRISSDYVYSMEKFDWETKQLQFAFQNISARNNPLLINGMKYTVSPSMRIFDINLCNVPEKDVCVIDLSTIV